MYVSISLLQQQHQLAHGALQTTHGMSSPVMVVVVVRQSSLAAGETNGGGAGLLAALGLLWSHWQALEVSDNASRHSLLPQKQPEVTVRPAAPCTSSPRRRYSMYYFPVLSKYHVLAGLTVAILTLERDK